MRNNQNFLISCLLTLSLFGCSTQYKPDSEQSQARNADDLLIVDCLLPGQIRQLGRFATYLTARRAIKTSVSDCTIRGGEFVPPSQADYHSALKVWMPRAEAGDPEAQAYVGEIYEKGYGRQPDYHMAAVWYRKAADQGDVRAQVNLGYLYEKGMGVEADKEKAVKLYAKSVRQQDLPYATTLSTPESRKDPEQIKLLQTELKNSEAERAILSRNLQKTQQSLQRSNEKIRQLNALIEKIKKQLEQKGDSQRQELQQQLLEQQSSLEQEQDKIQQLEQSYQEKVSAIQASLMNTEKRAEQLANQLKTEKSQSNNLQIQLLKTESSLAKTEQELLQQKASLQNKIEELSTDNSRLTQQQDSQSENAARMAAMKVQLETQRKQIESLEQEKKNYQQQLTRLQDDVLQNTVFAKPSIEIIDPSFVYTRGIATVKLRSLVKEREVIGKVDSDAGLLSLLVNDKKNSVEDNGLFRANLQLRNDETPVKVVAIDKQGQKASLDFVMMLDKAAKQQGVVVSSPKPWKGLNFGQFHALIIGNNHYQKVPSLDTPQADAKTVASLLSTKYGFKTRLLLDATRYQILSALNKLRGELTENDNLLIYYAGHGELDKVNMRGHWLPVDADADNTANWISTIAITDILNAMSSKHVLVIADSCYSGAMTRSSLARLQAGMSSERQAEWIKAMIKTRSRTVLTSGGLKPVMDGGGGGHSVFAKAFINALRDNDSLLEGQKLYRVVSANIVSIASRFGIEQVPEYAPIRHAGHESGEFFFVPN